MATRHRQKGAAALSDANIAFDLDRLFDHYNMDHIPRDRRLDGFKTRDLPHIKHYKAAVNIFGGPISRKRTIVAPPMETPLKRKLGLYSNLKTFPTPPVLNSPLKAPEQPLKLMSSTEILNQEDKEKEDSYKQWLKQRQALRGDLEGMGLSEAFLRRKGDKTALEQRVQTRLQAARLYRPPSPPPPPPPVAEKEPPVVPSVKVPVPLALQILDEFLTKKKMRLVDLFRSADTNNDWKLTKDELQAVVDKYEIPMTAADIEDMMVTLDSNFDEHLDFKEISKGIANLRNQRRLCRRLEGSPAPPPHASQQATGPAHRPPQVTQQSSSTFDKISPSSRDQMNFNQNNHESSGEDRDDPVTRDPIVTFTANDVGEEEALPVTGDSDSGSLPAGSRSSSQHSRVSTPLSLEAPPPDLRPQQRQASSQEEMLALRKHDRAVLERAKSHQWPWPADRGPRDEVAGVIRIGHKTVDQHCLPSTLGGEVGELMDSFRQAGLREYFTVIQVCQEKGMVLTPELLDRVLLYPPELPRSECVKRLGLPVGPLASLTESFARAPRKPKTPPEVRHKDTMRRASNGTLMMDARHMYPPWVKVAPQASKENLSTGRALIARKTDNWMSFEEYDKYTKHLPRRYKKLSIKAGDSGMDPAKIMSYTRSATDPEALRHSWRSGGTCNVNRNANSAPSQGSRSTVSAYTHRYQLDEEKFWPGYMLDKLVLYEPDAQQGRQAGGMGADNPSGLFRHTGAKACASNLARQKDTGPPVGPRGESQPYGLP